jgi:hypothetical protein
VVAIFDGISAADLEKVSDLMEWEYLFVVDGDLVSVGPNHPQYEQAKLAYEEKLRSL